MNKSKSIIYFLVFFITIIFLFPAIIMPVHSDQYHSVYSTCEIAVRQSCGPGVDLDLVLLEVWWAPIQNGTLYVRYLVDNIGQTYHNPYNPIKLNITLQNISSTDPFAFINQSSYIDPYTWYANETLGGCVQIPLSKKPSKIMVFVNKFQHLPEYNMDNNIKTAIVYHGVVIKGQVFKENENKTIPASKIDIKRCNKTSLQSTLAITFKTNQTGSYILSLYPQNPLSDLHEYSLMFTDKETTDRLLKTISLAFNNTTHVENITFQGNPPNKPWKPVGMPIGVKGIPAIHFSFLSDKDDGDLWFKYKIHSSYSPWIGPFSSSQIIVINPTVYLSGRYSLQLIVKDSQGLLSSWSKKSFILIL